MSTFSVCLLFQLRHCFFNHGKGSPNAEIRHYFWQRLIRFLAKDGLIYYGDAILPADVTDITKTTQARIIKGNIFGQHHVTDQIAVRNPTCSTVLDEQPEVTRHWKVGCKITTVPIGKRRCKNRPMLGTQLRAACKRGLSLCCVLTFPRHRG